MDFAWRVAKHVKSNAIVLASEDSLIGVGAGQMSRVDAARIAFPLRLQSVIAGQRFRPAGRGGSRKVNRFLNDCGIPFEKRYYYPVLMMEEQIVALPGLAIDESFRLTAASRTALVIKWRSAETGEKGGR